MENMNGLGTFLLGSALVQCLFVVFKAQFTRILGIYRLFVLAFLSVVATISLNIVHGKTLRESIFSDASTLLAYQVLIHQVKKQWEKQEDE